MSPKARVLVVANRTVDSSELIKALRQRAANSPACFTLLVPAVPRGLAWGRHEGGWARGHPASRSRRSPDEDGRPRGRGCSHR